MDTRADGQDTAGPHILMGCTRPPPWIARPGLDLHGLAWKPPTAVNIVGAPPTVHEIPLTTTLKANALESALQDFPNQGLKRYVLAGAREGFRVKSSLYVGNRAIQHDNLPSAVQRPEVIHAWLDTEVASGRIHGPLDKLPAGAVASPLGSVPKSKREPISSKFRTINHWSYTADGIPSVNAMINKGDYTLTYMSVLDLAKIALAWGRRFVLPKWI